MTARRLPFCLGGASLQVWAEAAGTLAGGSGDPGGLGRVVNRGLPWISGERGWQHLWVGL